MRRTTLLASIVLFLTPLHAAEKESAHEFWLRIRHEEQPQSYSAAANFGAGVSNEFTEFYMGFYLDAKCRVEVLSKKKLRVDLSNVSIAWAGRLPDPDGKRRAPGGQWGRKLLHKELVAANPKKPDGLELSFTVTPKGAKLNTKVMKALRSEKPFRKPPLPKDAETIHVLLKGALERMIRQGLPQVAPEIRKLSRTWSASKILVPSLDRKRGRRGDMALIVEPGPKKQPRVRSFYVPKRGKPVQLQQKVQLVAPKGKSLRFAMENSMFYTRVGKRNQSLKADFSIERFAEPPPPADWQKSSKPAGGRE